MSVRAFISYARDDDALPSLPERSIPLAGFVTHFRSYLKYELKQLGPSRPEVWRDTGNIEKTEQFEDTLEREVGQSDFLIVVLSPNWLNRHWCRRELDRFARRWAHEGTQGIRKRVLVVNKRPVDDTVRPELLQGQEGHDFFRIDLEQHAGARERPYFDAGQFHDREAFVQEVRELAHRLHRLSAAQSGSLQKPDPPADRAVPLNGRTIFLARPAGDMRQACARISNELKNRGFAVVPETDIPNEGGAVAFIEAALAKSEISIHLIGNRNGVTPEYCDQPIVAFQLRNR